MLCPILAVGPISPTPRLVILAVLAVAGAYAVMSVVAACAIWWDKRAARRGAWRTRESTLHTIEMLGGWPGSWVARRRFRHKTRKPAYHAVFVRIVAFHSIVWILVLLLITTRTGVLAR